MWYRTGTITLKKGTTKVLGVGTKWTDKLSNVEEGQPLIVNGNIYEITEVRSDTELYIKETALADATATPYVIMSVVYGSLGDVALKASKALAHYQEQMQVFDMMYTGTQKFKVTKPDGTDIEMYPYSMLSVDLAKLNQTLQTVATHATNAKTSETNAKNSAISAASSATSASSSATTATASANAANLSASNAKTAETNASKSATAAATSATSASTSASNAKTSETNAKKYADALNMDNILLKDDNLAGLKNKEIARGNLGLQELNNVPNANTTVSATKDPLYGFGFVNDEVITVGTRYATGIQAYQKNAGGFSLWQQAVSDVKQKSKMFFRNIVINSLGEASYGNPVELLSSEFLGQLNTFTNDQILKAASSGVSINLKFMGADGGMIGFVGKGLSTTNDIYLGNYKTNKHLVNGADGNLTFAGSNVVIERRDNFFTAIQRISNKTSAPFLQSINDNANVMSSIKEDGTARFLYGINVNGLNQPLNARRYSEDGSVAGEMLLHTDGRIVLSNVKAGKNLVIEANGLLTYGGSNVAVENRANTFTGGSQVSSTNGMNFVAKASSQGVAAYYSVRDADNSNIGYVGKSGTAYDFIIVNQKTGKALILRENGLLHYANNEVLTTGNAGGFNGIGSNFVRVSKATSGRGQTVSGSSLEALLSGSWIAMNYSSFIVGSETFYAQIFTRIS